ncbi:hypothetical protein EYF80_037553 [Liparis tanakae]|uniref:Uncharacterized protein n=1 Tax=Liparis tanakae TaxID=230148 RepID=A0A4Z2GFS0_9TELE|nr:hypothetical protein EYF80_037553 [Liparis tanakae]
MPALSLPLLHQQRSSNVFPTKGDGKCTDMSWPRCPHREGIKRSLEFCCEVELQALANPPCKIQ